ncbi:MAG: hypothetical protein R3F43_28020 [bacterium]
MAPSRQATGAGAGQQCESCGVACDPTAAADRCTNRSWRLRQRRRLRRRHALLRGRWLLRVPQQQRLPGQRAALRRDVRVLHGRRGQRAVRRPATWPATRRLSNRCGNRRRRLWQRRGVRAGDRPIRREDRPGPGPRLRAAPRRRRLRRLRATSAWIFRAAPATPADHAGCDEAAAAPICDAANATRRGCGSDASAPPARVPATSASAAGASAAIRRTTRAARPSRPSATP